MQQASIQSSAQPSSPARQVVGQSFLLMFGGMLLAMGAAWWTTTSDLVNSWAAVSPWIPIAMVLVWVVLTFGFRPIVKMVPAPVGIVLFVIYALLTGVSLSTLVAAYTTASLVMAFGATVLLFAVMTALALFTGINFRGFSFYVLGAAIALIAVTLLNFFWLQSSTLNWVLSLAGVVLFSVSTAGAVQQIEQMAETTEPAKRSRVAIVGAALLFTNFVILFTRILQATGKKK